MEKGKATCNILKDIRQKIADANGIAYAPHECHHEGDCPGTCPACEAEIRYLEEELAARHHNGWNAKVAGLAAGVCAMVMPLTSCTRQSTPSSQQQNASAPTEEVRSSQNVELIGDIIAITNDSDDKDNGEAGFQKGESPKDTTTSQSQTDRRAAAPRSHQEKCKK